MAVYQDIREFHKCGGYRGMTFSVMTWHEKGRYAISAVDVGDLRRIEDAHPKGFESLREALDAGEMVARTVIDEQFGK